MESRKKMNILHNKWRKGNWLGQFLHENSLQQHVIEEWDKWREDEEEEVSSW